jgi:hypothetical protein
MPPPGAADTRLVLERVRHIRPVPGDDFNRVVGLPDDWMHR